MGALKDSFLPLSAALLLCGCATSGDSLHRSPVDLPVEAVELRGTPFFPQTDYLCGPAALATILNQSGVEVGIDELRSAVYIPQRKGSLQLELLAAARGYGRIPYQIEPNLVSLVAELSAGRPVLILQNLGFNFAPIWHYAVVVGYLPEERRVVLRSGDIKRYVMSEAKFLRTWQRGDRWGLVVLPPDKLPAVADEGRYLRAVAALESIGNYDSAVRAYETASRHWPATGLALLGLGNAQYARGDLAEAERAYRLLLRQDPGHAIALNNLAQTLADRGCVREATTTIERALVASETAEPLLAPLLETKALIADLPQTTCSS
ncbi:MAG: PA2778 family cysteine peptidase [Gammaproteobacteria bacterium]|nr:PA2778 family cysteine peptidase [Gammaproteobacteria bacterium]MDH3506419.1 PA2778 family cysteine peptidase [Gammaproteobacteria bacterium]